MCFGICSKFTVAVGAWGPAAAEAIDSSQAADALHLMNDSGLLEDGVGEHAGSNGHGHGKGSAVDGAVPDFVTALALAPQFAAVVEQNFPQGSVEPTSHGSADEQIARRKSCGVNEIDPSRFQIEIKAVFRGDFGGNLPEAFRQRIIGGRFCSDAQRIARRHPHAAFLVMNDFGHVGSPRLLRGERTNVHGHYPTPLDTPPATGSLRQGAIQTDVAN